MTIAHASSPEVVATAARQRASGARVWVESCPQYFTLLEHETIEFGALRKFTPPARARTAAELDQMWQCLANGQIDLVSSDHAPSTKAQKEKGSIWEANFGLPGIDTTLSILLDGAHRGLISYERLVEVYSERPAKLYGLYPRKGHLGLGADADIVLVDPESNWLVTDGEILSKAGWSPFSGRRLTGRAVATYLRGELVASDGRVLAEPGTGEFLPGLGARVP
jgi:dihydroorotase-like cyclic amidohydrolase